MPFAICRNITPLFHLESDNFSLNRQIMDHDTQSDDTENDEKATDGTEADDTENDGCSCMQSHDVDMDMFRSMYADDRYNEYPEGITLNEFKQLVVVETAEMLKKSALTDQDVEARLVLPMQVLWYAGLQQILIGYSTAMNCG